MSAEEARRVLVAHISDIADEPKTEKVEATVIVIENWLRSIIQEEVRNASLSR